MADFKEAFEITMGHEGTYDNDPDDVGGETYRGIARRYHPNWEGWKMIDDCKRYDFPMNDCLRMQGEKMNELVEVFYKDRYWNPFWGDWIENQQIANELFDTGVNMGVGRAIKFLQIGLNVLNRNGRLYSDIVEDGSFGNATMRALRSLPQRDMGTLYKIINVLQGMHYISYMKKSPTQEKYARGWFNRVEFKK